jgi:hypothetical protein
MSRLDDYEVDGSPCYGRTVSSVLEDDRKLLFQRAVKLVDKINQFYELCSSIGLETDGMLPSLELAIGELGDFSENKLGLETPDERDTRRYIDKVLTSTEFDQMAGGWL